MHSPGCAGTERSVSPEKWHRFKLSLLRKVLITLFFLNSKSLLTLVSLHRHVPLEQPLFMLCQPREDFSMPQFWSVENEHKSKRMPERMNKGTWWNSTGKLWQSRYPVLSGRGSFLKVLKVSKTLPLRAAVGVRSRPCPDWLPLAGPAQPPPSEQPDLLALESGLCGGKKCTGLFCPHRIHSPQSERVWTALVGWACPVPPEGATQGRACPQRPLLLLKAMS